MVPSVLLYTLNAPSIADKNSWVESIKALGKDAQEIAMILAEKFKNEGIQAGVQKGMQAGAEKKTYEIARNLLSNGLED